MMKKSDFFYELPEALIAQHPSEKRDGSRLLHLDRQGRITDGQFRDVLNLFHDGDLLVLNDTKVLPARLIGSKRDSGLLVEFLLLKRLTANEWEVLVRPGRRLREGAVVDFLPGRLSAEILEIMPGGNRRVRFDFAGIWEEVLDEAGTMPLPPYIHEQLENKERYQTVYAKDPGSAAAPTAGLHFTRELLDELETRGVELAYVTLHVGLGTFRPVKEDDITAHPMHAEYYELSEKAAKQINAAKSAGRRIISVGTTSTRVLESAADESGHCEPGSGWTSIFIYPGYRFKVIDALLTNFHLPESTLIMLVSALAGREEVLAAYEHAVAKEYRFFSFGDAMFIEKKPET